MPESDPTTEWVRLVSRWRESPFHFVLEALFEITEEKWSPWVPGTPQPEHSPVGPEKWQGDFLKDVGVAIKEGKRRFTVRAGHGVGKSTMEAWIILWFALFKRPCKIPVTANSQDQLRDVVWAEIAHWHSKLPKFLRDELTVTSERVVVNHNPTEAFAVARTARPEKPEAMQGFHSPNLCFIIEEASGIEDIIFETAGGALSSEHSWVFMFANPTRTSGYFHRSHTITRDTWRSYHIPCHMSSRVSPNYAKNIADEYGEDSNVFRVRVLGEFPLAEDDAVIPLGWIEAAMVRDVSPSVEGVVWGLDVARFGDDSTALAKRRGNVLLEPVREWKKADLMQTAGRVAKEFRETPPEQQPHAINVDVIGLGGGVVDRLRELGLPVRGINVGEQAAMDPQRYMRLRDELWFEARRWFESKAVCMPRDDRLAAELIGPKYNHESSGKLKVESKSDMKKRGVKSPNLADAFCLTFAGGDEGSFSRRRAVAQNVYNPFEVGTDEFELGMRQASASMDWQPF